MPSWTVSELAGRFGLSRTTLLYYERIGLLSSVHRSRSGYRIYHQADLERLERIRLYRAAGLPLQDIAKLLAEPQSPRAAVLGQRLAELGQEILALKAQQHLLAALLKDSGQEPAELPIDKQGWVAMLEQAGMDEAAMRRWHAAFERRAPQAHLEFLLALGIEAEEAEGIRRWAVTDPAS